MIKFIASSMKLWLALCLIFCQVHSIAQVNVSTPEAATKAFYTWYIPRLAKDGNYPLMDKEIYRYVNKGTVDLLRSDYKKNKFADQAEYFTKAQDFDEKDWLANMVEHPAITLDGVTVVPVTFGSKEKNTVVVFLRKIDGVWKITKVDDLVDYS